FLRLPAPAARRTGAPPPAPPIPATPIPDPTARRGNMSEASVYMLAENPWCAAAARPIRNTAAHMFETTGANDTGTTQRAQTERAVFLATLAVHPRAISHDDSHPPATEPTSAIR